MSSLVVIPNSTSKTLTATGVVSVGESVSVSLEGLSSVTSARFRVVDDAGCDLARFPLADTDEWIVSGDDLTASVDFNTDKLRKAFEGVAFRDKMKLGIIVDTTDGTQVARGTFYILQWACASDEAPTVLPDVKKLLEDAEAAASSAAASATAASDSATAANASSTAAAGSANDAAARVSEAAKYAGAAQEAAASAQVDIAEEKNRATSAELANKALIEAEVERAKGVEAAKADLVNGKVPSSQLPEMSQSVTSVNEKTGAVVLTGADIAVSGSDETKVSAAIDGKLDKTGDEPLTIVRGFDNIKIDGTTVRFNDVDGEATGGTISGTEGGGNVELPTKSGTLALTDDIPSVVSPSTSATTGQAADAAATGEAIAARAMAIPLGDGVWRVLTPDEGGGFYVENGAVVPFAADKTSIAAKEFYQSALTDVYAAKATSIGNDAFYDCYALVTVSLTKAIVIGEFAFNLCTSLKAISLQNATSIEKGVFLACSALISISLPAATSIGGYAFNSCSALKELTLTSFTKARVTANASTWSIPSGQNITVHCSDGDLVIE